MTEKIRVRLPLEEIREYCATQPIARLSDFGSLMPDMLRPDTEIGLLVEYFPDADVTYIDMARQEIALGKLLDGAVDLRTPNEIERHFRQRILERACLVFAKNSAE